jgi:hypothetical protein
MTSLFAFSYNSSALVDVTNRLNRVCLRSPLLSHDRSTDLRNSIRLQGSADVGATTCL